MRRRLFANKIESQRDKTRGLGGKPPRPFLSLPVRKMSGILNVRGCSNGRKKIEESITNLKKLPDQVFAMLENELSVTEISDKLLVYPNTISSAVMMLEREGKVKKIEKEKNRSIESKWITK